jgi:signal transduction histidine kinase
MRYGFIIFLFFTFSSYSQNKEIDSLKQVLAEYEKVSSVKNDTLQIITLQRIAYQYINTAPDSAINIAKKSIKICSKISDYENYLDKSYLLLGIAYAAKGFHESALPIYYKALPLAQKYNHLETIGHCYKFIGDSFIFRKQYSEAESNYSKALQNYQIMGDSIRIKKAFNLLGNVYFNQKNYNKAYNFYQKGKNNANVGHVLLYLGKEKEGLALMIPENKKFQDANEYFQVVLLYFNIAEYYRIKNKPILSNSYAQKSYDLANKNNFQNEQMLASNILFQNYDKLGNKIKALEYLKIHQDLMKTSTEQSQKSLMNSLKFEYDLRIKQEELQNTTADLKSETQSKYYAIGIALLLVALLGLIIFNYRQTNKSKQLIEEKNDKLESTQNELKELNQSLEQKVNERTAELQKANQELIQKNQEIVDAMFKGQTFERKQVAAELHDNLGSQLSAMRWSILAMNKAVMSTEEREIYENVLSMMDESYNQIRNISHNLLPEELEKEGLQKAIEKLIFKLNRNQSISFSLNFNDYLIPLSSSIALEIYAIILELVNNIIRHSKATQASISFSNINQILNIKVTDNGVGLNPTHFEEGIGFRNIKARVDKIGATMSLKNQNGLYTTIDYPMPLMVIH